MKLFIKQSFGLGDILFLSPLIKHYQYDNDIIWMVKDSYFWVKDYLPLNEVTFVKESESIDLNGYSIVDFQNAEYIQPSIKYPDCMSAKYGLVEAPLELWRTIYFHRNYKKEEELKKYLGLDNYSGKYIIVNNNFASREYNYKTEIKPEGIFKIIELDYIEGFTLLDWSGVLENAYEIHTVSTALFFVIEALGITEGLHLYPRKPLDKDLSPIKSLLHPKWIIHD